MLNLSKNLKTILSSLGLAVVLFAAIFVSINTGRQNAQAEAVVKTAENLQAGLDFFYQDQNRFPTFNEFTSREVMSNYFSFFPPKDFVSKNCAQNFVYKRIEQKSYQLSFCLPGASDGFKKGWNSINEQK